MAGKSNKPFVFCWRIIKFMVQPVKRIRKYRKNNMKQVKIVVIVLAVASCFITLLLYYWRRSSMSEKQINFKFIHDVVIPPLKPVELIGTPMRHVPLDEIYKYNPNDDDSFETQDFKIARMLDTPGCQIPVSMLPFDNKKRVKAGNCGKRAVFLKKIDGNRVKAFIKEKAIRSYLRKSAQYECCYRFILLRSTRHKRNNNSKIQYTSCRKILNDETIILKSDFVNVKCSEQKNNNSHVVYDDVYAFAKMFNITNKHSNNTCKHKYNVLLLGMDSMSLPRFSQQMTRTVTFFKENYWLGFRGFHKIGDNTLPNLIAAFTGQNMTFINEKCSGNVGNCSDLFIWNKFKKNGYVTAYGEDYLRLPDTFHGNFEFKSPPTDHYMRPLFMKGETERLNVVCSGKVPSAQQVLDYAVDFSLTYRSKSFFGVFWINTYSHNINSQPQDSDNMFENFFNRLTYTGVLENTFVIFISDHGIRFGDRRMLVQSYYDERMPFMFIWTPLLFKGKHLQLYKSMAINQFRLLTPFDLHHTLLDINSISSCELNNTNYSQHSRVLNSCPKCHSMFRAISNNRTCKDAAIHEKWCSCHNLYPLDISDTEGLKSIETVVTYIKSMTKTVKTLPCWGCMSLTLKNVIRIHFYYDKEKVNLYHLVALSMAPGNVSYEAKVWRKGQNAELVGPLSVISPYKGLGKCTQKQTRDRLFCVCQKKKNCP